MSKRKPSRQAPPDEPETLDKLLEALSEHGLNFVLGAPLWERLAARGLDIIPDLLDRTDGKQYFKLVDLALQKILETIEPALRERAASILDESLARTYHFKRRIAAIEAYPHVVAKDSRSQDRLLTLALNPSEDPVVRTVTFRTFAAMDPIGPQAERLLSILDLDMALWLEHESMCDAAFFCLRQHALKLRSKQLLLGLEPFLTHESPRLRSRAIALIGAFGDVDATEHLFALPDAPSHRDEIIDAVSKIGSRPINLLSLRPDAFEAFVARLLKRMGYENVKMGSYYKDGGVDATCSQPRKNFLGGEREEWIVQCKRYAGSAIDEVTIRQFADTVAAKRAHRGLFVTTSDYTSGAREFAASQKNLELISGPQLLKRLEELFEPKRYTIRLRT